MIITAMCSLSTEIAYSLGVSCFTVTVATLLIVLRCNWWLLRKTVFNVVFGQGKLCYEKAADFMDTICKWLVKI